MRTPFFATMAFVSSLVAACGGSSGAADGPKSPSGEPGSSSATAAAPPAAPVDPGPTTTTTSTLNSNGDLQGAKLTTTSTTTMETKGTGAPKPGAEGEVGRRREDVQAIIGARRDDARKCYDDALKRNPSLEGDLDVKWTIDPKGVVTDASVDEAKSQIHDESLGKCIVAIIQKIKFAESPKGFESRMHYPFNFHPRGAQRATPPSK
ncbi:AgmX/PglI C-terminal domain-containing protein [Pendulispora albinea]|uniref:AgmX/PglI C-terminal domain-containing protein n=1 Tax=Pendulispora albinea TaxID=2741071 RepID=A0ABZ2M030_9BACT